MFDVALGADNPLAGVPFVPGPVEVLGGVPELHDEIARQVLRRCLAALLPPELDEGRLIVAHDNAGVRATDEGAAV
jgi:hypothetical protein